MAAVAAALEEPAVVGGLPTDWPTWAQMQEWSEARQDEWLARFVKERLGFVVPAVAVCPNHVAPLTALADAFFERWRYGIWWASRGGGKTLMMAELTWLDAVFKAGLEAVTVGGSREQASRCYRYTTETLWPRSKIMDAMLDGDFTKTETRLRNGSRYGILSSSTKAARGSHPSRLRVDEVDEMDADVFRAVVQVTLDSPKWGSGTVLASTRHRPYGLMQEQLQTAEARGYRVYPWCYKEIAQECRLPDSECATCELRVGCGGGQNGVLRRACGYYPIRGLREKRRQLDTVTWETEWECGDWRSLGGRVYPEPLLSPACEDPVAWRPDLATRAGVDWGMEQPTALVLGQDTEAGGVNVFYARYWHQVPLEERVRQMVDDMRAYGVREVWADAEGASENSMLESRGLRVTPVSFKEHKRASINTARSLLERGLLRIDSELAEFRREMGGYQFAPGSDEPVKLNDHGPDALAALMVPLHTSGGDEWWQDARALCEMAGLVNGAGELLVAAAGLNDAQKRLLDSAGVGYG